MAWGNKTSMVADVFGIEIDNTRGVRKKATGAPTAKLKAKSSLTRSKKRGRSVLAEGRG
jgi:hypothetical protein